MAAPETLPDFNERVHSDVWWKLKTGWTEEEYLDRKNSLLVTIRKKLPSTVAKYSSSTIADSIELLVVTFDDNKWCLPEEQDKVVVFAEQLRLYTKWAEHIQSQRLMMPKDNTYVMFRLADLSIPLLARKPGSPTMPVPQVSQAPQSSVNPATTVTSAAGSVVSPAFSIEPFNWDDTEVHIYDRTGLDDVRHHIPMIAVKPGSPGESCHWYDFSFDKFFAHINENTSLHYTKGLHSIFWIDQKEWGRIETSGDYKIMLKRFSKHPGVKRVLYLLVQRIQDGKFPRGFSAMPTLFERGAN